MVHQPPAPLDEAEPVGREQQSAAHLLHAEDPPAGVVDEGDFSGDQCRPAAAAGAPSKLNADAILPPAASQAMVQTTERIVAIGTSTGGKTGSEGIYVSRFDDATGKLTPPVLAAAAGMTIRLWTS